MTLRRPAVAACALLLASAGLAPADQKPVSPSSPATLSRSSLPVAGLPQKPDLVVGFEGSGPGLPTGFTVKNVGSVDSKLSVLKVTAILALPAGSPGGGGGSGNCPAAWSQAQRDAFSSLFGGLTGAVTVEKMKTACGVPFPEIVEAVPVLKPGESKSFARDTGPFRILLSGLQQPGSTQATHVKPCSPTLVCAWDVKALADASNDNDERSESNNTATKRALREVSFK